MDVSLRLTFVISESAARRLTGQRRSQFHFVTSLNSFCYITECGLSVSNGQAQNLKFWTVTFDLPWTPSCVRLPIEPALFAFSKTAHEKPRKEASLRAADSVVTIVSLKHTPTPYPNIRPVGKCLAYLKTLSQYTWLKSIIWRLKRNHVINKVSF